MEYYTSFIKDSLGFNFIGINIDSALVVKFLDELKSYLSEKEWVEYTSNQQKRDSGEFHLTVITTSEFNSLQNSHGYDKLLDDLDQIFKFSVDDIKFLGIGSATVNENRSFFIVCESEKLTAIRSRYDLPARDFHITIGFKWRDVQGVKKSEILTKKSRFLKELKSQFIKFENFNFIKRINNFDLDPDSDIIPLSISDNYLKIQCEDWIMDIGLIEEKNELFIFTKYKKTEDLVRLPLTEIHRIFRNI